jgi:hypothetical protein
VQAGDVVDAAEDRAARPGGKKRRARWLVARVAAAGTGSPYGSAGGARDVPGQRGATKHYRNRLAPEHPHGLAITGSRQGRWRTGPGRRRARGACGRMTGRCLPFCTASCTAQAPQTAAAMKTRTLTEVSATGARRFQGRPVPAG